MKKPIRKKSNAIYEAQSIFDLRKVNEFRTLMKMPVLTESNRLCLRCGKPFKSLQWDIRSCYSCRDFKNGYWDDGIGE